VRISLTDRLLPHPRYIKAATLSFSGLGEGRHSRVTLPDSTAQGTRGLSRGRRESAGKEEDQEGQDELRANESFPSDNHLSRAGTTVTRRSEGTALGISLTSINV